MPIQMYRRPIVVFLFLQKIFLLHVLFFYNWSQYVMEVGHMDEFNKEPNNNESNNKKINPLISKISKGMKAVTDKDGFYVILFICICIVTTTAVWVSKNNFDKTNNLDNIEYLDFAEGYFDDIEYLEENQGKDVSLIEIEETNTTKGTEDKGAVTPEEQKIKVASASDTSTGEEKIVSVMNQPTLGSIGMDYADNSLVYSRTLEQWTTHNAIDIKANEGTVVKAVLDGIVTQVAKDTELGIVITIDHGNGFVTKYGCLSTDEMVKIGQEVKKGDAISGIGKATGIELSDGPHLHFEVIKDGKNVNPKDYLPKFK